MRADTDEDFEFLTRHRAHDALHVLDRWQAVAARAGLVRIGPRGVSGMELRAYRSPAGPGGRGPDPWVYLCAGVHGDEPAGVLGLLEWAEANVERLAAGRFLVFPCFNPWGLAHNSRFDARGNDLNRRFDDPDDAHIGWWRESLAGHHHRDFRLALMLHEDYDAQGIYLYELHNREDEEPWGERLIGRCRRVLPPDLRDEIDGRAAAGGVVDTSPPLPPMDGLPEAIALHRGGAGRAITFETPSEFSLACRVRAHRRFLDEALGMLAGGAACD